jgi:hypothetical protein
MTSPDVREARRWRIVDPPRGLAGDLRHAFAPPIFPKGSLTRTNAGYFRILLGAEIQTGLEGSQGLNGLQWPISIHSSLSPSFSPLASGNR